MTKQELAVKSPFVVIGTFTAYVTDTFSQLLMVLLAVMAFDYTTGILRGLLTKSINSTIGLKGIFKKVAMIIIIGLTSCVEIVAQILGMETNNFLVASVIVFFIINEVISCLENCGQLGAPIPSILLDSLEKLREVGGKEQKIVRRRKKKEEK
jgi:toxin secretion/phage lysis holin